MSVLWVLGYDNVEVVDGLLVRLNHLVRFCALVDVAKLTRHVLDALREGIDRLFELLQVAVGEADVVICVRDVAHVRPVLEAKLKLLDALPVLAVGVVGEADTVE